MVNVAAYKRTADSWARDIKKGLRQTEQQFHQSPRDWKNDLALFRLLDSRQGTRTCTGM